MPNHTYALPIGAVIGLDADNTPTNYVFCNGSNGTRDLRDKLIIGVSGSTYTLGTAYGSASHTHAWTSGSGGGALMQPPAPGSPTIPLGSGPTKNFVFSATLNAGSFANLSNYPPFYAVNWYQATAITGFPENGIAWWTGTTSNIPNGFVVDSAVYNKFLAGAGSSFSRGQTGGSASGQHFSSSISGSITLQNGSTFDSGAPGATLNITGSWSGGTLASNPYDLTPLYWGLIPIKATGGTRGVMTGMVLAYNASLASLPAQYSEFTSARGRFIQNLSTAGGSGGNGTYAHTQTASWGGGQAQLGAGSVISSGGSAYNNFGYSSGTALGAAGVNLSSGNSMPSSVALYYIIAL